LVGVSQSENQILLVSCHEHVAVDEVGREAEHHSLLAPVNITGSFLKKRDEFRGCLAPMHGRYKSLNGIALEARTRIGLHRAQDIALGVFEVD